MRTKTLIKMNIVAVPIKVNAVTTKAKVNNESPAPSLHHEKRWEGRGKKRWGKRWKLSEKRMETKV